jgi:hypothetical protein
MSKKDIDYSNTIIYKITCKDENISDVYVGHTTNFVERKKRHKNDCTNINSHSYNTKLYKVIRDNGGWDNWNMEVVETCICNNSYEARKKEYEYFILLNGTLNSIKPLSRSHLDSISNVNGNGNNCLYCEKCQFKCSKQSNFDMHCKTYKHQKLAGVGATLQQPAPSVCPNCNKSFSHLSGLCRHKKKCISEHLITHSQLRTIIQGEYQKITAFIQNMIVGHTNANTTSTPRHADDAENITVTVTEPEPEPEPERDTYNNDGIYTHNDDTLEITTFPNENMIVTPSEIQNMRNDNQLCKKMMIELLKTNRELQAQVIELSKKSQTTTHQLSSSVGVLSNGDHNTINNNNQQYSLNFFLNEKCKHAMNMKDFVNSIQLNMTDMENVERLGYVQGMSNILINNLEKTDVYKRPVHCSDVKRKTLYVKENNEWEREATHRPKMSNAIIAMKHKYIALVNEWAKANPRCMNSNTRENERYMKLSKAVTDGDKEGNIAKVIKKVAKKVAIEKKEPMRLSNKT